MKNLHFESWEEKEEAAKDIEMLAKQVVKVTPKLMTELGVVPVLVYIHDGCVDGGSSASFDPVSSWKLHVSFRFLILFVHFAIYMHLFVHHCT